MTSGAKIGVALATGTGVIGGGVGLTYALKSETPTPVSIRSKIQNNGKNILAIDASKDSFWEIKLSTYNKKFHTTLGLQKQDKDTLKQWCTDTIKKDFKDENDQVYSAAKALCTVPTNSEKILSASKQLAENNDWTTIVEKYNSKAADNNLITEINKNSANKTNIEGWCKKVLDQELADSGNVYTATEKWCTKDGLKP